MLNFTSNQSCENCEGSTRRDFLRIGSLAVAGSTLLNLLLTRAAAREAGVEVKNKSVIWLWLSGGPTHVETFDPKMTAPVEYRSITGEVSTPIPGVTIGGTFPKIASVADKKAIVRSFAHGSSSHGTGTTLVMTGYNDRSNMRPSLSSTVSRSQGTNLQTGTPTYVSLGRMRSDGPGWLGTRYSVLNPSGQARKNMEVSVAAERFEGRRNLLNQIDRINRDVDRSGKMDGVDGFEQQAFDLVLGSSQEAFDTSKEESNVRSRYGMGLGDSLLKVRRLTEAGCGFVTVSYGGWDMHGGIKGLKSRAQQMKQAVSALIEDPDQRGSLDDTLFVITGEFGRTPQINKRAGRDLWGRLCTPKTDFGREVIEKAQWIRQRNRIEKGAKNERERTRIDLNEDVPIGMLKRKKK